MPIRGPKYRSTVFDSIDSGNSNIYCDINYLTNEAAVETFFVAPLLNDLEYRESHIKPKTAISEVMVSKGARKVRYKPDYILLHKGTPRWVLDAKAPEEALENWEEQAAGYCLHLNQRSEKGNPTTHYVLTNGICTRVYQWDKLPHVLELSFQDFRHGSPLYERFRALLSLKGLAEQHRKVAATDLFEIKRPTAEEARRLFAQAHRTIWESELVNPTAAFSEFAKLMFVKLWADRKLRDDPGISRELETKGRAQVPKHLVTFSTHWISSQTPATNPVNDVLFKQLIISLEQDIMAKRKKRIFSREETIELRPSTIHRVLEKLQHYDMFGIDEDLNGRLFETFLSATMRGRELGQFFTPRSVVKLMVRLAQLNATPQKTDYVIDACCGTGGFLIEVLADMRDKVRLNASLSDTEKGKLMSVIANDRIFGIDFGKNPMLVRIARMNMYLHGDGGSRMYFADSLDKAMPSIQGETLEVLQEQEELRTLIKGGLLFDVALTNPPFSMTKSKDKFEDEQVLRQYEMARSKPSSDHIRSSLRSSVMFVERYYDLLRPGGLLITVLDDTVLASKTFRFFREFIKKRFIIRGIVSLPGDAFRRQGSRVKTSVLLLRKKTHSDETQPAAFGAFALALGVDDLTPRASEVSIQEARAKAYAEIKGISDAYTAFLAGKPTGLTIPAEQLGDRLDLKYCVGDRGRLVPRWQEEGIEVVSLGELVKQGVFRLVVESIDPQGFPDEAFKLLSVNYSGECELEAIRAGRLIKAGSMYQVRTHDLIISQIRVTDGAIGIVPSEFEGGLVASTSYVVLRGQSLEDTIYLWAIMRSHEIRADLQSDSPGTNRYATKWEGAAQVQIPWGDKEGRSALAAHVKALWNLAREASEKKWILETAIAALGVESPQSVARFKASKAPT